MIENRKHCLEKYYPGDEAWEQLCHCFNEFWEACQFKSELVFALSGNEDISIVVFASVKEDALTWITQPIPALDGVAPVDCFSSEDKIMRLKTMLMRMPR